MLLEVEACSLTDDSQSNWSNFTNACSLPKFLKRSIQNRTKTAKASEQFFCSDLDVTPRDAECQEKLNRLVLGESVEPASKESIPQALTVPVLMIRGHWLHIALDWISATMPPSANPCTTIPRVTISCRALNSRHNLVAWVRTIQPWARPYSSIVSGDEEDTSTSPMKEPGHALANAARTNGGKSSVTSPSNRKVSSGMSSCPVGPRLMIT
jgi:hypothetical protein